ncbi:lambda-exonuclease family protein [Micromonospora purpureochromogenes]|uniref:YqaJ viral recombinase family nuclease n=1 Tax=Micromonospora purpureochromogenes TaxID=47872 RepID=UPI0033C00697
MTTALHQPELVLSHDEIRRDRERWLAARAAGIGASEIAAVLGISPYDSPFSLYWRKKLNTVTEMNEAMEWGLRHEATIASKFAENHPEYVTSPAGLWRHPQHRWMLATPDLHLSGGELAQIKTTRSWDGWGTPGTDQIPAYYAAQVQQEMTVMGARRCWVPVLCGGNSYREYLVEWNPADAALITEAGEAFMRRLADDNPPDLDGTAATTTALKQLHPTVVDEVVTIPQHLADQYATRRALLDDAKAQLAEVENQIRGLLGNAKTAVCDGQKVAQRSVYDTSRIDTRRLKAEQPDTYAAYATTSTVNKLTPAKESK